MGQDWVSWRRNIRLTGLQYNLPTYCGPLSDAGETEEVLAAFRPTHGLQLEPQQADRAPLNIILLAAAAAGVPPNAGDCLVIIKIVMITLLVV